LEPGQVQEVMVSMDEVPGQAVTEPVEVLVHLMPVLED
jgi:hypothetical protein